jgi:tetratricopeptide (TPR) repeat protein
MSQNSPSTLPWFVIGGILSAGALTCILICWSAFQTNGTFGFPLDDPWIHLQFARNLRDHGSFSYFGSLMVTSGSTSPLYTILLAGGLFLTSQEMVLSYALGISCFIAGAFVLLRIGQGLYSDHVMLIVSSVVLFLLEPRLQWAALSGMETTLFILLLLLVWYLYQVRSSRWLGIAAGLLLWTRPEAVILFAALALDIGYHAWWVRRLHARKKHPPALQPDYRWLYPALGIAAVLWLGYCAFNLALSGSLLPNTYAAKTRYYASGGADFPATVFQFLTGGHMPVLACLVAVAAGDVLWKAMTRARQEYLVPLFFSLGMFAAYWHKLPFLYQEGRYLMPLLPFFIVLGMRGIEVIIHLGRKVLKSSERTGVETAVSAGVALLIAAQFGAASWEMRGVYAESCKYITDRQVKTAFWIRDRLPVDAVLGTHDIGALAFYSGRRVVDMVGLVSPDMIENIGSYDRLKQFLARHNVTHLAVLRNWFEVVNQNPVFQTDERTPEIMEVFRFDPSRTHFTPRNAGMLTAQGAYFLSTGQVQRAGPILEESLRMDPQSAPAHCYLGLALLAIGKDADAEREISTALALHPDSWEARIALAHVFQHRNDPDQALALLEEVAQKDPAYAPVYQELAQFYLTVKKDTAAASEYARQHAERVRRRP